MMGLSMVSLENIISSKAFNHKPNMEMLSGLARGTLIVAVIYGALKIIKLFKGGVGSAFDGSMEANMYILEMLIGVIIPIVMLLSGKVRASLNQILFVDILVVAGILLNRLNVAVFGVYRDQSATGLSYFPSVMEFIVTLALVAAAIFGFKLAAKYLKLFPEPEGA
jgi:Ni/Fe-hydrogenase subunit HybB-like protein